MAEAAGPARRSCENRAELVCWAAVGATPGPAARAGPRTDAPQPRKVTMPDRASLRRTLVELLEADTGEKYDHLDDAANLREGLGLDSVDVVSIVSQIERRFKIRLTHEELEK